MKRYYRDSFRMPALFAQKNRNFAIHSNTFREFFKTTNFS